MKGLCAGHIEASRELAPGCLWASQNAAALVLSIPNPQGKEKEEELSLPGEGGGKLSKKCSAILERFAERT